VWWSPFYWSYGAVKGLLSRTISMDKVLQDCSIVVAIAIIIYMVSLPKIKRELK
jgi:hypothetical protein